MNLFTYRLLTTLALPLIAYSGWKRCRQHAKQQRANPTLPAIPDCFLARFGFNRQSFEPGGIWVHAVSVGETRSIFPLLSRLKQQYPNLPLTVTNGSTQGAMQALQFSPVAIQHQMIPYDYPFAVKRFLNQIQPKLVIMVETEIWPNLYQACSERQIPVVLINARLKEKSFDAYLKWGGSMLTNALNQTQWIAAQFPIDAEFFKTLGAHNVKTFGNIKFDIDIPSELTSTALSWRANHQLTNRFIWVAASTHQSNHPDFIDEEQMMLNAHQQLLTHQPDALLILVPRHADRFASVANMTAQSGLKVAIRSQNHNITPHTQVYLADTIGELLHWFAAADAAFIGGSLVPFGGHNILEPAAMHKPVISGPYFANLQALYQTFIDDQALSVVADESALALTLIQFAQQPQSATALGEKAYQCFDQQSGALNKTLIEIDKLLS